ncbi:Rho termination factor N-terminal domain-containing protein, partial [Specibacter sp. RAF43]|uniref:Rho termination factor N-terminal domain-containing protein n=1 Tax=Specibacter sp. RAF43 TaxID=3233057 RepID=UPI003F94FC36
MTEIVTSAAGTKAAELNGTTQSTGTAKSAGLAGLKLAQLQALAGQLGITGGSRMRKGDLVAAISAHQRGSSVADRPVRTAKTTPEAPAAETSAPAKRTSRAKAGATADAPAAPAEAPSVPAAVEAPAAAETAAATERPARG